MLNFRSLAQKFLPSGDLLGDGFDIAHHVEIKTIGDGLGIPQEGGEGLEIFDIAAQLVEFVEEFGFGWCRLSGLHDVDVDGDAHHGGDGAEDFLLEDADAQVFGHVFVDRKKSRIKSEQIAVEFGVLVLAGRR